MKLQLIAGVDEVGRGPLAGPVVAAAVILDINYPIVGLADSKKLTARKREQLTEQIKQHALAWAIGRVEPSEIDVLNIHHASLLAMKKAIDALTLKPAFIQVDGKFCPNIDIPSEAIIGGDAKIQAISAASIIAKVTRDAEMVKWHQHYPEYGFNVHSGYPTKRHLAALEAFGVSPIHRRSYEPVRRLLQV
jgi:ribonuclease HII